MRARAGMGSAIVYGGGASVRMLMTRVIVRWGSQRVRINPPSLFQAARQVSSKSVCSRVDGFAVVVVVVVVVVAGAVLLVVVVVVSLLLLLSLYVALEGRGA